MRISKMWFTTLLLAVTSTTVLLAGCGGGDEGQTAGQINTASAAALPRLGTEQSFAVLGGQTVTNTGPSVITGNLGVSPGSSVTGFPPGIVTGGTTHLADAMALQAQSDTTTAYTDLEGQACTSDLTGTDLGTLPNALVSGVYCFTSSAQLTGTLTLDAEGNSNAVWVFKTVSALTTASGSSVRLINGGQPCNVFWQIGSSAVLGTTTSFVGNIYALTSIALQTGTKVSGRALARNGAVTLDSNTVAVAACGVPPVTPIPPTLGKTFSPASIDAGGVSTLTITLSNSNGTAASLSAPLIDTLPGGVVIATTPHAGTTCGGTVAAVGSTVTLTGGSIPASGSCTVTADVTAPLGGSYINSLSSGALQTSNGNNAAPAVATLIVNTPVVVPPAVVPPTLGKAFSPGTINAGGVSTLTITLTNANSTVATLTAQLIDTLPSGLVVVAGSISSTCIEPGAPVHISPAWFIIDTSTVGLTGGSIPANGSCTVTAQVTAPLGGSYFNSLPAGALQTTNGNNAAPAVATLTVNSPSVVAAPTLGKSFSPATIGVNGVTTITITLSNANGTAAHLTAPLIDTLPPGLVAVGGSTSSTCIDPGAAPAWFVDDILAVGLTGGSIPANGSCTVTAQVRAPNAAGSYLNTLSPGALQTTNGNNAAPAVATLTVM